MFVIINNIKLYDTNIYSIKKNISYKFEYSIIIILLYHVKFILSIRLLCDTLAHCEVGTFAVLKVELFQHGNFKFHKVNVSSALLTLVEL